MLKKSGLALLMVAVFSVGGIGAVQAESNGPVKERVLEYRENKIDQFDEALKERVMNFRNSEAFETVKPLFEQLRTLQGEAKSMREQLRAGKQQFRELVKADPENAKAVKEILLALRAQASEIKANKEGIHEAAKQTRETLKEAKLNQDLEGVTQSLEQLISLRNEANGYLTQLLELRNQAIELLN